MTNFVPIHMHSEYSLLDGMITVKDLIKICKDNGYKAAAITDHGNMSAAIEFYEKFKKEDLKPIIGSEFYLSDQSPEEGSRKMYHIVLLAKDNTGYQNLLKLTTFANTEWFYYKPRINYEVLGKYSKGLICCSACIGGDIPQALLEENIDEAKRLTMYYKTIFGEDFYIELQDHGMEEQKVTNPLLIELAKKYNIPMIITNDAHYPSQNKAIVHDILLCKNTNSKLSDPDRFKFFNDQFYLKTEEELRKAFEWMDQETFDQCIENTGKIADKCDIEIKMGDYFIPPFEVPEGHDNDSYLKELALKGLQRRYGGNGHIEKELLERLNFELETIKQMGFPTYFLIVRDFIKYAKSQDIPVGPARGCLTKNVPILTKRGYIPLNKVKIGDDIINMNGEWDKVINTMIYPCEEKLLKIKTWTSTFNEIKATKDHKILVLKDPFKNLRVGKGQWVKNATRLNLSDFFKEENLTWIEAKDIKPNDYLVRFIDLINIPKNIEKIDLAKYAKKLNFNYDKNFIYEEVYEYDINNKALKIKEIKKINRFININKDFCYFIGYYIGDGWYSNKKYKNTHIGLAFNHNKKLKCLNFFKKYFENYYQYESHSKNKNLIQLIIYSKILFEFIKDHFIFGSENKMIPEFMLNLPEKKIDSLINGLLESDGYIRGKQGNYDSTSLTLIYQLRILLEKRGYKCNIHKRTPKYDNWKTSYKLSWNLDIKSQKCLNSYNNKKYLFLKIKDIQEQSPENVYDITVKKHPSYLTSDFIVHNSVAGSLVAYCIEITEVDPIKYNLLFERFLNPARISMPDIDVDFCYFNREKVIDYVKQKYGEDKVCGIATFGTLSARAAVKAVASVLDLPFFEANALSKLFPDEVGIKIKDALEQSEKLRNSYENNSKIKEIIEYAMELEDIKSSLGTHAAGILISKDPLKDIVPIVRTKGENYVSGFTMEEVEKLGLLKMDFLGLRNLSVIKSTAKSVVDSDKYKNIVSETQFNIGNLPLDDKKTFKLLQAGKTVGVFQLESQGMRKLLSDLKPTVFSDIDAVVALFRPGPLGSGMVYDFVERKNGRREIEYPHPSLEPVLKDTYGCIVYQEQVMKIAQVLAGYTLAEADELRKVMGKKKVEKIPEEQAKFMTGCEKNGVDKQLAEDLFNSIKEFAEYGFNRCLAEDFIPEGQNKTLKELSNQKDIDIVLKSYDIKNKKFINNNVEDIFYTGDREIFEIEFSNGQKEKCTLNHKFLCVDYKYYTVEEIINKDLEILEVNNG